MVVAALQRAVDEAGPLFLLKDGTLLQHRLGLDARATRDIDGLVRGDLTRFLVVLDEVIRQPSITQPMAGPWDSPKLVTAKSCPKVLPLITVDYPRAN